MQKLLLLSVLFATLIIPIRAAQKPNPTRALRRAIVFAVGFNVFYVWAILWLHPRLPF